MQVINHGISEQAMQDMAEVGEEFFRLPAADKVEFCSEDITKGTRLFSGTTYGPAARGTGGTASALPTTSPSVIAPRTGLTSPTGSGK